VKGNLTRKSLVVVQFATGIALVASLIIIVLQMKFIQNKSLGYDGTAIVQVVGNYGNEVTKNYDALRNELLKNSHITHVSKHNGNVVGGLGNGWTTTENLKGEEISTSLYQYEVDPDYLATYNMSIVAGRFFSKEFPSDTTKGVLVNETAVKTFGWEKPENAIGKRFGKGDHAKYVVGVLRDFHFESLHKPVEAVMLHYARFAGTISLKVDASHADEAIEHLKSTWASINPEVPLLYSFVDEDIQKQYGNEQKMQSLFYAFSALSLIIACIGLFGLSIFVVERKIKEISIRKSVGCKWRGYRWTNFERICQACPYCQCCGYSGSLLRNGQMAPGFLLPYRRSMVGLCAFRCDGTGDCVRNCLFPGYTGRPYQPSNGTEDRITLYCPKLPFISIFRRITSVCSA
jgi:putative ABC transport system permease protein